MIIIFSIALCFTHIYNDILIVAKSSHNMWDYFFSGRLLEYYNIQPMIPGKYYIVEQSGLYPIVPQVILSIWEFPVWLIGKICGNSIYNTIGSYCWLKLLLLVFYYLCGQKIYIIVKKICNENEGFKASLYFYSSAIVLLNTLDL